jgi:hypothetical protein
MNRNQIARHAQVLIAVMAACCVCGCGHALVVDEAPSSHLNRSSRATPLSEPIDVAPTPDAELSALSVRNVRLELGSDAAGVDAAHLIFDLRNTGTRSVTDLEVSVFILSIGDSAAAGSSEDVVAGPYTIRSKIVLGPGFNAKLDLFLSNLPPSCTCIPIVRVLSTRTP